MNYRFWLRRQQKRSQTASKMFTFKAVLNFYLLNTTTITPLAFSNLGTRLFIISVFLYTSPLKCRCNGKIVDLILIATEQHFRTKLNGAFSFSISCLVSEIFRFLKHAN